MNAMLVNSSLESLKTRAWRRTWTQKLSTSSIIPWAQPSSNVDKQVACASANILLIVFSHHAHPGLWSMFDLQKQGFHVKRNYSNGHSADSVTLMTYRSLEEFICSGIGLHILVLHLLTLKCENLYICLMVSQRLQRDQCLTTSCRGRATSYQLYALRWKWWGIFWCIILGERYDKPQQSNQKIHSIFFLAMPN